MTTPYTIRPATEADAETIKRIVRSNPLDPNAVDWRYFLVLEVVEDGKAKIASIGMVHPEGEVQELDSVATLPEYRKRGYAEAIVRALIERIPQSIYLLSETKLIAYYEKLGFRVMSADEAPRVMTDQAEWVNRMFGDTITYTVMGMSK
ncbi:MAG: GNAT family N-acetyltransferase [Chloroflexota bacterium]